MWLGWEFCLGGHCSQSREGVKTLPGIGLQVRTWPTRRILVYGLPGVLGDESAQSVGVGVEEIGRDLGASEGMQ